MTLVQLEYVLAINTYGSFVSAAAKCSVTHPTFSMQIPKLDGFLGMMLFTCSKQPVIPTEIGLQIIEQARIVFQENSKIKEIIGDQEQEITGE